ncbi:Alpha-ketoglutarate-dependent 2,4-dichlorophenoxyacetate dioxygenase [Xanthomonas fragariae]|uniref:Alpha-ketoglutarate-dependent 2,4-dichlorophenoxyacetate dioxygenase n=1 Tax=Xanthomonas fragariae TaxID=48664 RepID=A0ABY1RSP1_9XANT|nr:Alpha-ketoglutarate-dependent 2,4-dichlorophenoxyacetate dioxygenase [Xanthomonas fragariae]
MPRNSLGEGSDTFVRQSASCMADPARRAQAHCAEHACRTQQSGQVRAAACARSVAPGTEAGTDCRSEAGAAPDHAHVSGNRPEGAVRQQAFHHPHSGLPDDESRALLQTMFEHSMREALVYRHRWQLHDMVFWDNRSVMHLAAGTPDYLRRRVNRITIEGDTVDPAAFPAHGCSHKTNFSKITQLAPGTGRFARKLVGDTKKFA